MKYGHLHNHGITMTNNDVILGLKRNIQKSVACIFFEGTLIAEYTDSKVCIIKNFSNSGVHNLTCRHDSLNLKGSAESGEKND